MATRSTIRSFFYRLAIVLFLLWVIFRWLDFFEEYLPVLLGGAFLSFAAGYLVGHLARRGAVSILQSAMYSLGVVSIFIGVLTWIFMRLDWVLGYHLPLVNVFVGYEHFIAAGVVLLGVGFVLGSFKAVTWWRSLEIPELVSDIVHSFTPKGTMVSRPEYKLFKGRKHLIFRSDEYIAVVAGDKLIVRTPTKKTIREDAETAAKLRELVDELEKTSDEAETRERVAKIKELLDRVGGGEQPC
ncbi:MAG: hypothetical protein DRO11_03420 [Methanobacteriota archaeon]|nr:MAG: hypothetical protein DRO11_03420 [Euryarchaeota archaeon]